MYQDIMSDFDDFKKSVAKRIKEYQSHGVKCKIPPPKNPNCRFDRFVVRHILVTMGTSKP
jgi:hypothetical protein